MLLKIGYIQNYKWEVFDIFIVDLIGIIGLNSKLIFHQGFNIKRKRGKYRLELRDCELYIIWVNGENGKNFSHLVILKLKLLNEILVRVIKE